MPKNKKPTVAPTEPVRHAWSCVRCKAYGTFTTLADPMKAAMTAHFQENPKCKTPRLSIA